MLGHLTVLRSPVPSASGSPERRGSTDPDPKSVTRESGSPELRVCISIMQEPMLGHLTVLRSPVPSASGGLESGGLEARATDFGSGEALSRLGV